MAYIRPLKEKDIINLEYIYLNERINRYYFMDQSSFFKTDFIKDIENLRTFVFEYNGEIVGFCSINEDSNILEHLFIDSSLKNKLDYNEIFKLIDDLYPNLKVKCYIKDFLLLKFFKNKNYSYENKLKDYYKNEYYVLKNKPFQAYFFLPNIFVPITPATIIIVPII